jgi:peptidoglycan/xylan/chitin deacetylase (PgdA/CDA1 family)
MFFQSENYIIHRLQKSVGPKLLAKEFLGDENKAWIIEDANEGVSFKENEIIVIPLKQRNKGGITYNGYQVVPILCYHKFAENCKSALCTPRHVFERQINYLRKNGYRVVSMKKLLDFLNYRQALPKRSVVITFDDGYRSVYNIAYPILKKYGYGATLFIYTDYVGVSTHAITWGQLKRMKADGFEIGSHTVSHVDLTKQEKDENFKTYLKRIEHELHLSKEIIDTKLGQDTIFLAFPYGRYNKQVLNSSKRFGYKAAVSVKRGSNPFFIDPLTLKRCQILSTDMKYFISMLKTFNKLQIK